MVDVTQDNQKEAISWKDRGNGLAKQGNYESAISAYNTGIGLDPTNTDILHNKSAVLLKLGRNDEAQECIRQIQLLQNPSTAESKPHIHDFWPPIIHEDIEETPPVIQEEKRDNPPKPKTVSEYCRFCGSGLQFKEAEICPNCGMRLKEPATPKPISIVEEKNPSTAGVCSFFIPGLGQVYNGEAGKGLAFLIVTAIATSIFIIPGIFVWAYGIYDAYNTTKKMNSGKIQTKKSNTVLMVVFIVIGFFAMIFALILAFATMNYGGYYFLLGVQHPGMIETTCNFTSHWPNGTTSTSIVPCLKKI